ncbi:hypothetical protein A3C67_01975 [Candidatus Nomurabacteria bacterium RIFCSPHIGHO2_02_FULL_42_19]|uniref:GIY-YIG domain-containing protein n=1 Tax=Candidatus Nomurabacteria bacterium RIFCSPHIGHO2_02_FULL_42_19 TaxID=1801756 RepID=A0A1F6W2W5_9BACT|nr:MAG: hypothetical protein A3C67_01975 [Candidatus Nomurabacteria bacterium RIFCSPHIGHO2_02_FULL_42_19]
MKNSGVYILESQKNGRYYVGSTDDIDRRIREHNVGKVLSTKNVRPWKVRIFINCENLTKAKQFEYKLKKYKRKDILEKVIKDGIFPWNY